MFIIFTDVELADRQAQAEERVRFAKKIDDRYQIGYWEGVMKQIATFRQMAAMRLEADGWIKRPDEDKP